MELRTYTIKKRMIRIICMMICIMGTVIAFTGCKDSKDDNISVIGNVNGQVQEEQITVLDNVVLEAGTGITLDKFLSGPVKEASFITDINALNNKIPCYYDIEILADGVTYHTTLTIQDTVAPSAIVCAAETALGVLPDAAIFVSNIHDVSPVTITYHTEPDVETEGKNPAIIKLTDSSGNSTLVDVIVNVIEYDETPPVITGASDMELYIGDSISYRANVSVSDNKDESPILEIDNSQVNLNEPGEYQVIYTASDSSGNVSSVTVTLTVREKPETYIEPDVVYAMAEDILDQITDDSMDDMQVGYAIYYWCRNNIKYVGTSDKTSWTRAAYDAFKTHVGDCFSYYAAAKAMLDVAGIENIIIERIEGVRDGHHYWNLINLGDGWYHLDASPRNGPGDDFFMVTDEELLAYSDTHNNTHKFDPDLYPERATESVQYMINYRSSKLEK